MWYQAQRRLSAEHQALQRAAPQPYTAHPNDTSLLHWFAHPPCVPSCPFAHNTAIPTTPHRTLTLRGPPATPYSGGTFYVDLVFPAEYPARGPEVRFLTRVFHPQVGAGGETWLALTDAQHWRSTYGIADVATALLALLAAPTAAGACANADAARMLDADDETFAAEAARWTAQYARRPF